MIEQFHFLRPWWLLGLVALAVVLWRLRRQGFDGGNWRSVIDPRLLPYVLSSDVERRQGRLAWLLAAVLTLAIIALAGPTWEQRQQAVYQQPSALVVALDLSRSMDAADIKPTRLVRARHKIADILNSRKEGQSALVVYAADAFAVTPLTSDVETILALLPDLETGLMPAQGTRADRALQRALELFDNSAVLNGDLLLVSDGFSDPEVERLEALLVQHPGHRVSVLAIGTPAGAPIPLDNGGFLKNEQDEIVIAEMNVDNLRRVADLSGGAYTTISADDIDVNTLTYVLESSRDQREAGRSGLSADLWYELGPSLLLFALPLAALAFRRGLVWMLPLFIVVLPPDAQALDWQSLWRNGDQRALQLFQQGEHEAAAKLFDDDQWQAAARYRAGDFAAAAKGWDRLDGDDARYNYANALAQQGRYQDALEAYDRLLQRSPDHADARFNRDVIADWLEQQQARQQQQQDGQQQQPQQGKQGQQGGEQQANSDETQAQDNGDQGSSTGEQDEAREQAQQGGQSQSQQQARTDDEQHRQQQSQSAAASENAEQEPGEQKFATDDDAVANLDQQMSEQAAQQWLRKIPDDPGGLLRRKFIYQYRRRGGVDSEEQPW